MVSGKKKKSKVAIVLEEFKRGTLNIGKSKKKVKSKAQALAIALDEARRAGEKVSPKKRSRRSRKSKSSRSRKKKK
jgi:hypothetical protein